MTPHTRFRAYGIAATAALTFFACSHSMMKEDRKPSSGDEKNYLRVATYSTSPDNYLVLIGIDRSQATDPNITPIDANTAGFKSTQDISHLDPKYLLTANKTGIQQVYSFELGKLKADRQGHVKAELPKRLLDVQKWRTELLTSSFSVNVGLEIVNELIGDLELSGAKDAWSSLGAHWENPRRAESSYLEQMLATALDQDSFPELMNAVPFDNWRSELEDLGAALSVRYHLNNFEASILQSKSPANRDALYRTLRANMEDSSSRQFSSLNERANAECLVTERLTTSLALLEFDKDQFKNCVAYNGRRLDLKGNPAEIVAKLGDLPDNGKGRIPLGLYILNDQNMFIQLIDFTDPTKIRNRELLEKVHEIGLSVAELLASTGIGLGVEWVDNAMMFFAQRQGTTILSQRLEGYADLMMLLDTGLASVDLQDFVKGAVLLNLQKAKISSEQLDRIKTGLNSEDNDVVERSLDDAMEFLGYSESGVKGFGGGEKSQINADRTRTARWNRFAAWMSDSKNLAKADQQLTTRAQTYVAQLSHQTQLAQQASVEKAKQEAGSSGQSSGNWFTHLFGANKNDAAEKKQGAMVQKNTAGISNVAAVAPSPTPSADPVATRPDTNTPRPVILFMVDGLRPDRLITAVNRGQLPNIKARFVDHGVQMNSFTNYSVSLPSWSTVLTGFEPDQHGLHSSSTATRDSKKPWTNLLDFRPDTHMYVVGHRTRLYKRFLEAGVKPIQDYFSPNEVLLGTVPVSDIGHLPVKDAIKGLLKDYQRLAFGTFGIDPLLDISSGNFVSEEIKKSPGKSKLVLMWFGSVDHSAHSDNRSMFDSYRAIDEAIGVVLAAAKNDPVLKDATVVLVSDHGEMGGEETPDPARKPIPDAYFLENTTFNVMQFFTGDLPDSRDYRFVASSSKGSEPVLGSGAIAWPLTNVWEPYFYTYNGTQKNPGVKGYHNNTTVLTEPFGDAMAHIIFLKNANADPTQRFNYYQLTHFPAPMKKGVILNVVEDLLNHKIQNVDFTKDIKEKIRQYNGFHPVQVIGIPLQGDVARKSAETLTGNDPNLTSTRDPIVVRARDGKAALLLVRDGDDNEIYMRYVPIKNFDQNRDGTLIGQVSMDPNDDPFGYVGEGVHWDPTPWKTDREWLSLLQDTSYPTGISSLPRHATLHKSIQGLADVEAELPDMDLVSAYGFTFNPFQMHEGDHGGLTRDQVRTSMFISDDHMPGKLLHVTTPVFNRDVTPTILDYLGVTPDKRMPGRSMKPVIENAVQSGK